MNARCVGFLIELHITIVQIGNRAVRLPAQADIQSQPAAEAKRIAGVERLIMITAELDLTVALIERGHQAQQVIRLIETRETPIEADRARTMEEVVLVITRDREFRAPDQIVTTLHPAPGVGKVDVRA